MKKNVLSGFWKKNPVSPKIAILCKNQPFSTHLPLLRKNGSKDFLYLLAKVSSTLFRAQCENRMFGINQEHPEIQSFVESESAIFGSKH